MKLAFGGESGDSEDDLDNLPITQFITARSGKKPQRIMFQSTPLLGNKQGCIL